MPPVSRAPILRAFSLVELLAVMAVMAILGSFAIGAVKGAKQRAALARARGELAALGNALEEFKRIYGDYPQLYDFPQIALLTPTSTTTGPGVGTAQAKLFNCLTGVFGPRAFNSPDRVNGPNLLDVGRFTVQGTPATNFLVPTVPSPGQPPVKVEQNLALLDPWGRYYVYYYKSSRNPALWQAPSYILYSAGPDGAHTAPANTGIWSAGQLAAANNADNVYAITP
ncbi:MAG: prepilin-type N-terminal cleavage/methylation domain-containing protein [Verrucomicrobia bacterium]|nr:prepilin-type N-terminal cleavage/methylation domain-containing protein [Verrucomicrobiota bacterium]